MERTKAILKHWPLHLTLLLVVMLSEQINTIKIPIGSGSIMFLPLLYAMVIGLLLYLLKPVKWINDESSHAANSFVVLGISVFMAKISVNSGAAIAAIAAVRPAVRYKKLSAETDMSVSALTGAD